MTANMIRDGTILWRDDVFVEVVHGFDRAYFVYSRDRFLSKARESGHVRRDVVLLKDVFDKVMSLFDEGFFQVASMEHYHSTNSISIMGPTYFKGDFMCDGDVHMISELICDGDIDVKGLFIAYDGLLPSCRGLRCKAFLPPIEELMQFCDRLGIRRALSHTEVISFVEKDIERLLLTELSAFDLSVVNSCRQMVGI